MTKLSVKGVKNPSAIIAIFCIAVVVVFLAVTFVLAYPSLFYSTITFETDHGTEIEPITFKNGATFVIPDTYRGYNTFGGWFLDAERTVPYDGGKIVQNTTLYAKWYTVFTQAFFEEYAESMNTAYGDMLLSSCFYSAEVAEVISSEVFNDNKKLDIFVYSAGQEDGLYTEMMIGLIFNTLEDSNKFYNENEGTLMDDLDYGNFMIIRKDLLILLIATGNEASFLGQLSETEDFVYAIDEAGAEAAIISYRKDESEVLIPSLYQGLPVTAIGAYAFTEKNITNITLGENIKTVGKFAFKGCDNLTSFTLSPSVTMLGNGVLARSGIGQDGIDLNGSDIFLIEDGALYDTKMGRLLSYYGSEENFVVRKGTKIIDACAFEGASELKHIVFTEGLRRINQLAFAGCYSLEEVNFPKSLDVINYRAFSCSADGHPSALEAVRFDPGCEISEMYEFVFENNISLHSFVFPEKAFALSEGMLTGCISLTELKLPQGLTEIPSEFCSGCTSLRAVNTTSTFEIIGDFAFRDCNSLENFDFSNITEIGTSAFENCFALAEIVLSDKLVTCDTMAFSGCVSVKKLVLPSTLKNLGYWAMGGMSSLEEITLPLISDEGQNRLWFYLGNMNTQSLQKISINSAATAIPDHFFAELSSVKEIVLPDGVETISAGAFSSCSSLTTLVLPSSLNFIGNSAFFNCASLASIMLPEGLTEIDTWAFCKCSSLSSIALPASLKRLGNGSFKDCTLFTSAFLPDNMEFVGDAVFAGCFGIKEFKVPLCDDSAVFPKNIQGYTQDHSGNFVDNVEKVTVSPGTTVIPARAFTNMEKLVDLTFPSSVTRFDDDALVFIYNIKKLDISCASDYGRGILYGCDLLEELTLNMCDDPANDKPGYLGYFFLSSSSRDYGYENLYIKKLDIRSKNSVMGKSSFISAKALEKILLPDSLTEISDQMFLGCSKLIDIEIPSGVIRIGKNAFFGCEALLEIGIPATVDVIDNSAFQNCSSLHTVDIEEGSVLYSLGDGIFYNCIALENINFRDYTIWRITQFMFYGCSSLKNINLPEGIQEIQESAFSNSGLVAISIPARVNTIGKNAFLQCRDLKTLEFDDIEYSNITSIGFYAFMDCTSLEKVVLPKNLLGIGIMAFYNCASLREVYVMRAYDYNKSWDQACTQLTINGDGPAAFDNCDPDIKFYVPMKNGNVEYDGQYGSGSVAGVTAYKTYGLGWGVYADRIFAINVAEEG